MKRIIVFLMSIMVIFVFASCSSSNEALFVTDIQIDENGHLLYTISDGSTLDAGNVKGQDGKDGMDGVDGEDGLGIQTAKVNESGDLIIEYTDGTLINAGHVVGADGKDGQDGENGKNGKDGENGKDGAVPYIGDNGNWFIDNKDTGVKAGSIEFIFNNKGMGTELIGYVGNSFDVVIPEKTTKIAERVFEHNDIIETVSIPGTVKEIGRNAFGDCKKLKSITLNSGLEYIGESAFYNCPELENLEIPDTVRTLAINIVDGGCEKLESITIRAKTPPKVLGDVNYIYQGKWYVPAESVEAYRTADGWSYYKDNILPIP